MSENFLYLISYSLTLLLTLFKLYHLSTKITLQAYTCRFTNHDFFHVLSVLRKIKKGQDVA